MKRIFIAEMFGTFCLVFAGTGYATDLGFHARKQSFCSTWVLVSPCPCLNFRIDESLHCVGVSLDERRHAHDLIECCRRDRRDRGPDRQQWRRQDHHALDDIGTASSHRWQDRLEGRGDPGDRRRAYRRLRPGALSRRAAHFSRPDRQGKAARGDRGAAFDRLELSARVRAPDGRVLVDERTRLGQLRCSRLNIVQR